MVPAVLAGRVFRVAAVGIVGLIFYVAAFVVAEEKCDANGGGALCSGRSHASPIADVPPNAAADPSAGTPTNTSPPSSAMQESLDTELSDNASSVEEVPAMPPQEAGLLKLSVALGMLLFILVWLMTMLKFALDGSLPARLALWGLLPEAYAAISVRAVFHLLRLKSGTTPVVVLRNCLTDEGALTLVKAMTMYGKKADLQVVELPHNPLLTNEGLQAIVDAALREDSKIAELDFSYNPQFGDAAVKILKPVLELKRSKIQVLKLADIGLSKVGLREIAACAGKSKLTTLDLSWNSIKGAGEAVVDVLEAPILEELVLTCCDLSTEDVATIAEQLPYTSLRSLQLGGNRFGSPGVERLCEHLADSRVDELGLESVGLEAGCSGLNALAAAWVKRPFSRLRLYGNRMSDDEINTFVKTLKSMQI